MYYLCEKHYKAITVQYYIADCVSWIPRLCVGLTNKLDSFIGRGFPGGSDGKESAYSAGDPGSIPGSGRSPREGIDNSLQYSCLENSMDTGA